MNNKKEKPKILPIANIKQETNSIKTFTFKHYIGSVPGQFVMLWIPRIDQIPISISRQTENSFNLSIFKVGKGTNYLFKMKEGEKLGISGPYGKGFNIKPNSNIILVGGGCGTAPLRFLGEEAIKNNCNVQFITGAKVSNEVLFKNVFPETYIATDDGSEGIRGFTTDILKERLENNKIDRVYTCGPELMMKKVVDICDSSNIECEVSLERYMKCGFGVCGQCVMDPEGICVCKEGPVFNSKRLKDFSEFGKYHRDKSGIKNNY